MSEALAIVDQVQRPKGVTKRQMRLAALLPRCETAAEALRLAGYSEATIRNNGYRQVALGGVKRASVSIQTHQRDSARGLVGMANKALTQGAAKMDELDTQEKLGFGLKAMELAHALGEHVTETGDGDRHKYRQHRTARIAYYMGILAGRSPQHLVLSPAQIMERLK